MLTSGKKVPWISFLIFLYKIAKLMHFVLNAQSLVCKGLLHYHDLSTHYTLHCTVYNSSFISASVNLHSFALLWEFPCSCGVPGLLRLVIKADIYQSPGAAQPRPDQKPPTLDKPCLCIKWKILSCHNRQWLYLPFLAFSIYTTSVL